MTTLAVDIGGANLKAAHSSGACRSIAFALWREPAKLAEMLAAIGFDCDRLLVTMTGELCDCFATRGDGVRQIIDAVRAFAKDRNACVWSLDGRFVSLDDAVAQPLKVASANWHALATWVARAFPCQRGLLVDVGSTTTDCIPLAHGEVACGGMTDCERLAANTLLYMGVRRTTLAAIGLPKMMAEHFATTADVYVLLGRLPEDAGDCDTADGKPLTREHAANRVLRMVGADRGMMNLTEATKLAEAFHQRITDRLAQAIAQHSADRIIVSGSGAFLAEKYATDDLRKTLSDEAATAACAHALLQLDEQ